MDSSQILAQWGLGALIGLAMAGAFLRAFFSLLADNRTIRQDLMHRHLAQEERLFLALLDCVNKNTEALEKAEEALQGIAEALAEKAGDEE